MVIKEFNESISPLQVESYLEKLEIERGIKEPVLMIDYLALMSSDRIKRGDNSYGYFKSVAEELRAIAMKRNLVIMVPQQLGRCLEKNTQLFRKDGYVPIKDVKIGDQIKGSEGYVTVVNKVKTEKQKKYKITLKSGKSIIVSANHIFPTKDGEKSLNSGLCVGDYLDSI